MNRDILIKAGIDYDDGMHRFCDNTAMYEKYLRKLTGLTLMTELRDAAREARFADAFAACHKLKAFVGNLSIPALYGAVCRLTESLRLEPVNPETVQEQLAAAETIYRQVTAVIAEEMQHE